MLRRFFSYYRPYKRLFIITFLCAIFVAVLELAFPIIVNRVVDTLLPKGDLKIILLACGILFAVYVFNSYAQYVVTYWGHRLGISIETDMRAELFEHIQQILGRLMADFHSTPCQR